MKTKKIEVLMAAYNGAAYIGEQIDSILAQTYDAWTLTISDDGSDDGTDAIVDEYVRRYPDRIRRVRSGRRFGSAKAHFMWLIGQCDAEWIALSDQDDVWSEGKLERLMEAMLAAQARLGSDTPVLVFSDQTVTDERLNTIAPSLMRYQKQYFERFDFRSILMQNVVTGGAMMINRALARLAGRCADTSRVIMHDWWLAAVAARFGEIVYIDEPLGAYRQHGGNSVGAKHFGSVEYVAKMLSRADRLRETIRLKKGQAREFMNTYAGELSEDDVRFLSAFGEEKSGFRFYIDHKNLVHGMLRLAGFAWLG